MQPKQNEENQVNMTNGKIFGKTTFQGMRWYT